MPITFYKQETSKIQIFLPFSQLLTNFQENLLNKIDFDKIDPFYVVIFWSLAQT